MRLLRSEPRRIGLSAKIAGPSVHAAAFQRAGLLAESWLRRDPPVELVWVDDGACAAGAVQAAGTLIEQGVRVVIGHFASAAAEAAAQLYDRNGVTLLLPAATLDSLTQDHRCAFRVCPPDSALAQAICADLALDGGSLHVENDASLHGAALSEAIRRAATRSARLELVSEPEAAQRRVFVGTYQSSVEFVTKLRRGGGSGPVYLTDDAVHPGLCAALGDAGRGVFVYGFRPADAYPEARALCRAHEERWGEAPGTYFVQTFAALQVAFALFCDVACDLEGVAASQILSGHDFPTVIGALHFENGEGSPPGHASWSVGREHLQLIKLLRN